MQSQLLKPPLSLRTNCVRAGGRAPGAEHHGKAGEGVPAMSEMRFPNPAAAIVLRQKAVPREASM